MIENHKEPSIASTLLKTRLIKDFSPYMYRNAATVGILKAISENDPSPAVKQLAHERLTALQSFLRTVTPVKQ